MFCLIYCFSSLPKTINKQPSHRNTSHHSGGSVVTPDKVEAGLLKVKPSGNDVDLNAFVGTAVGGRANTAFAALTFVVIQIIVFASLFVGPLVQSLTGTELFSSYLS
jgi:hypothetical protein